MRPHHRAEFRREDRGRRASRCADQPDRDRGLSRRESRARSGGQGMSSQLTSAPLLAVRGLKLGYDRTDAVKGIDFDVLQGLSLIHISEPTRRTPISYAVFCLKKKKKK